MYFIVFVSMYTNGSSTMWYKNNAVQEDCGISTMWYKWYDMALHLQYQSILPKQCNEMRIFVF